MTTSTFRLIERRTLSPTAQRRLRAFGEQSEAVAELFLSRRVTSMGVQEGLLLLREICLREQISTVDMLDRIERHAVDHSGAVCAAGFLRWLRDRRATQLEGGAAHLLSPPDGTDVHGPAPGFERVVVEAGVLGDQTPLGRLPWLSEAPRTIGEAALQLLLRVCGCHPAAQVQVVPSFDSVARSADFAQGKRTLLLAPRGRRFLRACPCAPTAIGCGYQNLDLIQNCPMDCSYCFLPGYLNQPGIVVYSDWLRVFAELESLGNVRVGTGELSDSLALERETGFAHALAAWFIRRGGPTLELKTKTADVSVFRDLATGSEIEHVVAGWTITPARLGRREERLTASVQDRLEAAAEVAGLGYRVALHLDPMTLYPGWLGDHLELLDQALSAVPTDRLAWISLGLMRVNERVRERMAFRAGGSLTVASNFERGFDGKLRYPVQQRVAAYTEILEHIRRRAQEVPVYLCMEESSVWREVSSRVTGGFVGLDRLSKGRSQWRG